MKKRANILFTTCLIFLLAFFSSCNNEETNMARLVVRMIDSPGDYQEVNVDIQAIEVNVSGNGNGSGWTELSNTNTGVYNLLELTNGLSVVLADVELPAGFISQIRLILGENNTLKMNDQVTDLTTPSSQQSGLKLQLNATLTEGITYEVLLDFDAALSVVTSGNSGKFNLKPVIRAIAEAQDGAIKGIVLPVDATAAVFAIQGTDTVASSFADGTGAFLIRALPGGNYTVGISPSSDYMETSIENVQVVVGEVSDIGTVDLSQ
jgi:hypothetical protein